MYEEDLAPDSQNLAKDKLKQARGARFGEDFLPESKEEIARRRKREKGELTGRSLTASGAREQREDINIDKVAEKRALAKSGPGWNPNYNQIQDQERKKIKANKEGPLASFQNKNMAAEHGSEDVAPDKEKEGRVARALRARQQAKRKAKANMLGKAGISGAGKGTLQKVRQIKSIIRVIRGGTLAGTSLGDVFFCLSGLFISLVGEWAIAKFQIVPGYKMFDPEDPYVMLDKILWYGGWAVVMSVVILLVVLVYFLVYLTENPLEAIKFGIGL
ncbi:MAG: hypothetical protein AAB880_00440 [Patescibacteria group bacterium]